MNESPAWVRSLAIYRWKDWLNEDVLQCIDVVVYSMVTEGSPEVDASSACVGWVCVAAGRTLCAIQAFGLGMVRMIAGQFTGGAYRHGYVFGDALWDGRLFRLNGG